MGITFSAIAADAPTQSIFQVRLVVDAASDGTEQLAYKDKDGQTLMLDVQKTPVLDLNDIESAEVVTEDTPSGQPQVRIMLTPQGRERLEEVSEQAIHKRLAIVIDGKVYAAPMIQAKLTSDYIPIGDVPTEEQAKDIAGKINAAVRRK